MTPDSSLPFVSCLMPTRDRPHLVPQAIKYWLRQDYPYTRRELVILDDGEKELDFESFILPWRVRHVRTKPTPHGLQRNRSVELAHGDVLCHWDDDDWYAPNRMRVQVEAILAGADLCTGRRAIYYDARFDKAWVHAPDYSPCGSSLTYRRELWREVPYEARAKGEDVVFLRAHLARGAKLTTVDEELFIYIRHGLNATGNTWGTGGNDRVTTRRVRELLGDDRAFYQAIADSLPRPEPPKPWLSRGWLPGER